MPPILIRIDDRLIHGQVVVGWAGKHRPGYIIVLDDDTAADAWESELACAACPDAVKAEVYAVEEGGRRLMTGLHHDDRVFILLRSTRSAVRLVDLGFEMTEINVGGLHHHPGSRAYLPFVYLDDSEVEDLRTLARRGVRLVAQDLPGNRAVDLGALLNRGTA